MIILSFKVYLVPTGVKKPIGINKHLPKLLEQTLSNI